MYEFQAADFYAVAKAIAAAVGSGYDIENALFDTRVSNVFIEITEKRFRVAKSDDDEEYYERLDFLFREGVKRYYVIYAKRLKLKIDFIRSQRGVNAWMAVAYVVEAEHQDGEAYWNYFESLEDLLGDFEIYLNNHPVVK